MELRATPLCTPVGQLWCLGDDGALLGVAFDDRRDAVERHLRRHLGAISIVEQAPAVPRTPLARYFAGALDALDDINVVPVGTDFQRAVWLALREIPAGQTISYGQLAARLGRPRAVRAVGAANGANPLPIVLPCHRVVGSDGSLTGYGGGVERKTWLLRHEGAPLHAVATAQQQLPF